MLHSRQQLRVPRSQSCGLAGNEPQAAQVDSGGCLRHQPQPGHGHPRQTEQAQFTSAAPRTERQASLRLECCPPSSLGPSRRSLAALLFWVAAGALRPGRLPRQRRAHALVSLSAARLPRLSWQGRLGCWLSPDRATALRGPPRDWCQPAAHRTLPGHSRRPGPPRLGMSAAGRPHRALAGPCQPSQHCCKAAASGLEPAVHPAAVSAPHCRAACPVWSTCKASPSQSSAGPGGIWCGACALGASSCPSRASQDSLSLTPRLARLGHLLGQKAQAPHWVHAVSALAAGWDLWLGCIGRLLRADWLVPGLQGLCRVACPARPPHQGASAAGPTEPAGCSPTRALTSCTPWAWGRAQRMPPQMQAQLHTAAGRSAPRADGWTHVPAGFRR